MEHPIDLKARARQAMVDAGFDDQFPPEVLRQAQELQRRDNRPETSTVAKDLRSLLWSSVDNPDSRDLDQIEFAQQQADGWLHLLVAIADVDSCAPKGSPIDQFAANQTTSIYTGIETFPMLPEALSTDLTSLVENEDRMAMVADMTLDAAGDVVSTDIYPALVRNHAKLDYVSLGDWFDHGAAAPQKVASDPDLVAQLRAQNDESSRLEETRARSGALNFETIEATPVVTGGQVTGLTVQSDNSARDLIENFMIAANRGAVDFLRSKGFPTLQRVVREPERWSKIVDVAASYGEQLPSQPDSEALSRFLARRQAKDPSHFPDLSLTIVKLLGPGEYVAIGPDGPTEEHFGLAVHGYAHSTAPNRRYADLVTQRLLKAAVAGQPAPYSLDDLQRIAQHCNEQAEAARRVERLMRKVIAASMLRNRIGQVFQGIVTGVSDKGTYVRLISPPAEGRIVQNERGLDVGDKVNVKLIDVDPWKGFIDFSALH